MVGIFVEDKSSMKKRNSKYAVSIISVDPKGERNPTGMRFYLDAEPSEELTMEWFMINNVWCHFMNAGGRKEVNCRLDRRDFWRHGNMILMPMYAFNKNIQSREKLCWDYDPNQQASST
jgi:hypothetical protein